MVPLTMPVNSLDNEGPACRFGWCQRCSSVRGTTFAELRPLAFSQVGWLMDSQPTLAIPSIDRKGQYPRGERRGADSGVAAYSALSSVRLPIFWRRASTAWA